MWKCGGGQTFMLEWNSNYATGVPAIDLQHKVLFDSINRIEKLLDTVEVDRAEAVRLLEFLEQVCRAAFPGRGGLHVAFSLSRP